MSDVTSNVKSPDGKMMIKTPQEVEAEKKALMGMPSLAGPQDALVPKTPQVKGGSIGPSKEVPQQQDQGKDGV